MNKIGIIFAMKEELEATKKYLDCTNEYKIFDLEFYECKYKDKECILVECGIGKVNAARCTQILIDNIEVSYILNVGVAGSISNQVKICDIVIANNLVQHDFNLKPFNYERGYIPRVGKYIECDEYLLRIAKEININNNIHIGTIASGDIFVTEEEMGKKINKKLNALCVEMEGASIAQICYLSNIPFLVIRSISDSPNKEENNKLTYEEFLEKSAATVAKFLINFLEIVNKKRKEDNMNYVKDETTEEERLELVYKALGISMSDADKPSDETLNLANEYIKGNITLEELQQKVIMKYKNVEKEDENN